MSRSVPAYPYSTIVLAALVSLAPRSALCQAGGAGVSTAASVTPAAQAPLKVWIDRGGTDFDSELLRASLSRELGREVVIEESLDAASVRIRLEANQRAQVSYTTPSGEELTRTLDLPANSERSLQVLSWLTVNLVRDEASELLDELRARRKEQAGAVPAAETQQPAPTPAAGEPKRAPRSAPSQKPGSKPIRSTEDGLLREPTRRFDLSLATPISLLPDSARRELFFELSAAYADLGGLVGSAFSMGGLRIRKDVRGAAFGLVFAHNGGTAEGLVASVGYSQLNGNLRGILLGVGAAVHTSGFAEGAVLSVGAAVAGDVDGVLGGVGVAIARSIDGVAFAAGVNVLDTPSAGILLAGGANISSDLKGTQVAGGINVARDLSGAALAPVNVHRKVRGLQLGVVNVAEEVDGAALGIISIAGNGRLQPVLWGSANRSMHLALKSIAGYAFSQLGAGIGANGDELTLDAGVGGHIPIGRFFLEPGVHYSNTQSTSGGSATALHQDLHYLVTGGFHWKKQVDLLVGAGVAHGIAGSSLAKLKPELRAGIAFF